jgi:hypothetical protein
VAADDSIGHRQYLCGREIPGSGRDVPHQRQPSPPANRHVSAQAWRQRVQFVVLLQIAEQGYADTETLAAIVLGGAQRRNAGCADPAGAAVA